MGLRAYRRLTAILLLLLLTLGGCLMATSRGERDWSLLWTAVAEFGRHPAFTAADEVAGEGGPLIRTTSLTAPGPPLISSAAVTVTVSGLDPFPFRLHVTPEQIYLQDLAGWHRLSLYHPAAAEMNPLKDPLEFPRRLLLHARMVERLGPGRFRVTPDWGAVEELYGFDLRGAAGSAIFQLDPGASTLTAVSLQLQFPAYQVKAEGRALRYRLDLTPASARPRDLPPEALVAPELP